MIGIIVILGISWVLLHFIVGKDLTALGIFPISKRIKQFTIGLIVMGLINIVFIYAESIIKSKVWEINPSLSPSLILKSFWYHLKSALTEDLIFRGALLYILISKIKLQKALILSAIAFGVYHWFSYGMIGGRIIPLIFVFVTTGFIGYAWAYSFAKTKSIYLPLGFHLGWNFISTLFTETVPFGELILRNTSSIEISEVSNLMFSISNGLIPPMAVIIFVNWWMNKEKDISKEEETTANTVENDNGS